MNIPCFLKEIDGQQFNIAFSSIEDMELFIIKVSHENAKQNSNDTSQQRETAKAKRSTDRG